MNTLTKIAITKARVNLGAIIKRIRIDKDYVILEKDGYPVAGIMDIDEFEDYLELRDPKVKKAIAQATADYKAGKTRPIKEFIEELQKAEAKKESAR